MYSLPNQPINTSDNYQYFKCPRGARFTIQAFGSNAVDIGIGRGFPAPQYNTADVYLAQTTWVDSLPVDEIRFKSHVPGKPGQIAITVMTVDEVGGQPAPGGLFPNYLSLNPDGTLDAVFSGIIHASGGDFAGTLNAADGTFTGVLSGVTGDFSGDIFAGALELLEEAWPGSDLPPTDANEIEWSVTKGGAVHEGIFGAQKRYENLAGSGLAVGAVIGIRTLDEPGTGFITTWLQSPRGPNFVVPASQDPAGSDINLRISREYSIDLTGANAVPAGGTITHTVTIVEGLGSFWQPHGYFNQQGGGFLDQCGWSVSNVSGNDVDFTFHNHNVANNGVGAFVFRMVMAG